MRTLARGAVQAHHGQQRLIIAAVHPWAQLPSYVHRRSASSAPHLFCSRSASQVTAPCWNSTTSVLPPKAK